MEEQEARDLWYVGYTRHLAKSTRLNQRLYFRRRDLYGTCWRRCVRIRIYTQGATRGTTYPSTTPARSYDHVKQVVLNLHVQPQEFTLVEPLTIMRFHKVGRGATSSGQAEKFFLNLHPLLPGNFRIDGAKRRKYIRVREVVRNKLGRGRI